MFDQLINRKLGIFEVYLLEKENIDHNAAIDGYLDRLFFAYIEGVVLILAIVNAG